MPGARSAGARRRGDRDRGRRSGCAATSCKKSRAACRERGLPGIALCVGNTYGSGDWGPTPHGALVRDAARGRMYFSWDGGGPSVDIDDAARALILAETKGRVGERCIIAERWLSFRELLELAARAGGARQPLWHVPNLVMETSIRAIETVARLLRIETTATMASLECSRRIPDVDATRARTELGWSLRPIEEVIRDAVAFYTGSTRVGAPATRLS